MAKITLRSITPDKIFDLDKFESEAAKAINKVISNAEKDFKKTVATWSRKPEFKRTRATPRSLKAEVSTQDEIYGYVTRGTRPHVIRPRRSPVLRFQTGYRAKTKPRRIGSSGGGARGPFVTAKQVFHPGTEARDFDIVIAENRQKDLVKEARKAIKRATS